MGNTRPSIRELASIADRLEKLIDCVDHDRDLEDRCRSELIRLYLLRNPGWRQIDQFESINREWFGIRTPYDGIFPPMLGSQYNGRWFDHPSFFQHKLGCLAIASHPYGLSNRDQAEIEKFTEWHGLYAEYPDFPSWWHPNHTRLIWWTSFASV